MKDPAVLYAKLSERFPFQQISKLNGLHYIDIASVIHRLNDACGLDWGMDVTNSSMTLLDGITYGQAQKQAYRGDVTVSISISNTSRGGVGSDIGSDVDSVYKTALANAEKKAGNQFGIGLYLWDERERDVIDILQALAGVNQEVNILPALTDLIKLTKSNNGTELMKALNLKKEELKQPDIIANCLFQYDDYIPYKKDW